MSTAKRINILPPSSRAQARVIDDLLISLEETRRERERHNSDIELDKEAIEEIQDRITEKRKLVKGCNTKIEEIEAELEGKRTLPLFETPAITGVPSEQFTLPAPATAETPATEQAAAPAPADTDTPAETVPAGSIQYSFRDYAPGEYYIILVQDNGKRGIFFEQAQSLFVIDGGDFSFKENEAVIAEAMASRTQEQLEELWNNVASPIVQSEFGQVESRPLEGIVEVAETVNAFFLQTPRETAAVEGEQSEPSPTEPTEPQPEKDPDMLDTLDDLTGTTPAPPAETPEQSAAASEEYRITARKTAEGKVILSNGCALKVLEADSAIQIGMMGLTVKRWDGTEEIVQGNVLSLTPEQYDLLWASSHARKYVHEDNPDLTLSGAKQPRKKRHSPESSVNLNEPKGSHPYVPERRADGSWLIKSGELQKVLPAAAATTIEKTGIDYDKGLYWIEGPIDELTQRELNILWGSQCVGMDSLDGILAEEGAPVPQSNVRPMRRRKKKQTTEQAETQIAEPTGSGE